jgi:hypothetical protein
MIDGKFYKYLIIQYIIMLFIPTISSLVFEINPYINGIIPEIAAYMAGVAGIILYILISLVSENDYQSSIVMIVIKLIIAYPLFTVLYLKLIGRKWISYTLNMLCCFWAAVFGLLWQVAVMQ